MIFLFPRSLFVSFGICSTPKLSKYFMLLPLPYKAIQRVPIYSYLTRFNICVLSFILGKLLLE